MGVLLLDSINQPADLKQLNEKQVEQLCEEIRSFLLKNISKTGGHLASNLGMVELTVALHRVLETPQDKIVFDVGHQCYTHKILTGRRGQFEQLRQLDGISGFPNPNESVHDAFIAGHGNTALSLAIGMAWAKKLHHEQGLVVAVIGDGAFTGGMVYEGMNNIEHLDNLLVILNDNKMSISKNVGALARYLTHLRTTTAYVDAKDNVRGFLDAVPLVGTPLKNALTDCKTLLRRAMYHSTMFEDMGFQYLGPVDGHNVEELERTLRTLRGRPGPHFLHVITKKGKGYQPAEVNPGNYHGVSAFDLDGMPDPEVAPKESFSTVFGKALVTEGEKNQDLCAITAAMKYGTGLQFFAHSHPTRFFDVGMAEQHAVTFAAGLASQGMLPVGPRAIRYPRGGQDAVLAGFGCSGQEYDYLYKNENATIVLVSYADELTDVLQAAQELKQKDIVCDVLKLVKLYPFTEKVLDELIKYQKILFAEECIANGSIGEHLECALQQKGWDGCFIHLSVRDVRLPHASVAQIKQATGLDAASLVQTVQMAVTKGESLS